jgi:hypothetical protein
LLQQLTTFDISQEVQPEKWKHADISKHKTRKQHPESDGTDVKSIVRLSAFDTCFNSNILETEQQLEARGSEKLTRIVGNLECQGVACRNCSNFIFQ